MWFVADSSQRCTEAIQNDRLVLFRLGLSLGFCWLGIYGYFKLLNRLSCLLSELRRKRGLPLSAPMQSFNGSVHGNTICPFKKCPVPLQHRSGVLRSSANLCQTDQENRYWRPARFRPRVRWEPGEKDCRFLVLYSSILQAGLIVMTQGGCILRINFNVFWAIHASVTQTVGPLDFHWSLSSGFC